MAKYKITFDRDVCIGVLSCLAVDDEHWEAAEGEAKVDLKDADFNEEKGKYELVVDDDKYDIAKDSEHVCPVNAIEVEKIEE